MKKIAIIGGGLAGTACAYVLQQAGFNPVLYEAGSGLANAASGNDLGLYNPRFTAELSPEGQYYKAAFLCALETFSVLSDIDWTPCGAIHLINDEKKERRFGKMVESWGLGEENFQLLSAVEASEVAGVALSHDALYLPQSGYVSPKKLCAAYASDIEVHSNAKITNLSDIEADAIILAGGQGLNNIEETSHLPLKAVRGQVTKVKTNDLTAQVKCNIHYGGYISAANDDWHMLGATFQRWLDHSDVIGEDDAQNIEKLADHVPSIAKDLEVIESRASVRTSAPDNFPIVGQLQDNLYISTAHGSHGIISSILAAHILKNMIMDQTQPLPEQTIERLSPLRYDRGALE